MKALAYNIMPNVVVLMSYRQWELLSSSSFTTGLPAEQILAGLLQAFAAPMTQATVTHGGGIVPNNRTVGPNLTTNDLQQLKNKDPQNNKLDRPKAYLNYVFFDNQFKFVDDGSGVKQVDGEPGQLETLSSDKVVARKNGYVYVYTSNESQQDVLFDNFGVLDITGPVLEETHYYPFGLTMAGISTVAPLKIANNYKFNGKELNHKEFSDGTGLDWYSYGMREYDPQIGRFFRVDPITDKFYELTPYQYASDNPIRNKDIDGLEGYDANLERWIEELGQGKITKEQYQLRIKSAAVGGLAGLALVGIVYSGGRALPLLSRAALWLSNPANQELVTTVGGLGVGLLDPTGQVDMPGTMDDAGRILGDMGRSVWKLNPLKRGLEIEKMLGGNLPKNFPVIDKFVEGEATSIKSIDLMAKSYNEGNGLFNTLKGYINKLEDFKGAQRGRTIIENSDITSKVLEVGIQPGKATLDQWEQISNAMKYAKEQDINLKLQFIQ